MSTCFKAIGSLAEPLGQPHIFEGAKRDWTSPTCVTGLDRDRAAGVNPAWNSRHRFRDEIPAVPMAW
jgi:hypothetical protein